jgi:hypothetical protein
MSGINNNPFQKPQVGQQLPQQQPPPTMSGINNNPFQKPQVGQQLPQQQPPPEPKKSNNPFHNMFHKPNQASTSAPAAPAAGTPAVPPEKFSAGKVTITLGITDYVLNALNSAAALSSVPYLSQAASAALFILNGVQVRVVSFRSIDGNYPIVV